MHAISPEMVLGKSLVDGQGDRLGEIVDVGLFDHQRVKFLVVEDRKHRIPIRTVGVDAIGQIDTDAVTLRQRA
jgi:hypothetical protein